MFGRQHERRHIDGYTQVGPSLGVDSPDITYEQADVLRQKVAIDLFGTMNVKTSVLSEQQDKTFGARIFRPEGPADDENDTTIFSGAMIHNEDDLWRMRIVMNRSSRLPHNLGEKKIQTRYFLGAVAGRLILATKQVKAVRDIGDIGADLVDSGGSLQRVRRAYEKNLTDNDYDMLNESLDHVITRARTHSKR